MEVVCTQDTIVLLVGNSVSFMITLNDSRVHTGPAYCTIMLSSCQSVGDAMDDVRFGTPAFNSMQFA